MKRKVQSYRPFNFSPDFAPDANRDHAVSMQQDDLLALLAETRDSTAQFVRADLASSRQQELDRLNAQLQRALTTLLAVAEQLNESPLTQHDRHETRAALGQVARLIIDGQQDLFEQFASLHQSETNLPEADPLNA